MERGTKRSIKCWGLKKKTPGLGKETELPSGKKNAWCIIQRTPLKKGKKIKIVQHTILGTQTTIPDLEVQPTKWLYKSNVLGTFVLKRGEGRIKGAQRKGTLLIGTRQKKLKKRGGARFGGQACGKKFGKGLTTYHERGGTASPNRTGPKERNDSDRMHESLTTKKKKGRETAREKSQEEGKSAPLVAPILLSQRKKKKKKRGEDGKNQLN